MKQSNVIWFILGGLVLIALGFVVGYALSGGFTRVAATAGGANAFGAMPHMREFGFRMRPGFPFGGFGFFGLGWLMMLLFWLGPIAGIAALIIVLVRRPAAPPVQAEPPAVSEAKETNAKAAKK